MKNINTVLIFCLFSTAATAQLSIDGTFPFQNDPAKAYSLYIPSSYDESEANPAFLALHPFNTSRWNAQSWRDTLTVFAEQNGVILICPDGGPDGRIDDPIDTAFTTYLLDTVEQLYNIDPSAIYVTGFSWGARTTYTYGLRRVERFAGFMPIGAAINRLNEVGTLVDMGQLEKFFIIHGDNDIPNIRFVPVRDALIEAEACVNDTLLAGVGHTIDFPGRNMLLTMGYHWLRDQRCGTTTVDKPEANTWTPVNPLARGQVLQVPANVKIGEIWNLEGQQYMGRSDIKFTRPGIYFIRYVHHNEGRGIAKVMVLP